MSRTGASRKYNIEFISAETGEEKSQPYLSFGEVETLILGMQEGDTMVVNALGRQPDLHI